MKKNAIILGLLIVAMGLGFSGCATPEAAFIKDVPTEKLASLYLINQSSSGTTILETIDGTKVRGKNTANNPEGKLFGYNENAPDTWGAYDERKLRRTFRLPAGEHALVVSVSRSLLPGRASFTTTFNFEEGKRYAIKLDTDPSLNLAESAAASLKGDYVVIITDIDAPSNRKTIEINIDLSGGR
jgi:hypothetical protein